MLLLLDAIVGGARIKEESFIMGWNHSDSSLLINDLIDKVSIVI